MLVKVSLAVGFGVLQVVNGAALVSQLNEFNDRLHHISSLVSRQFEGTVCESQCSVFESAINTCTTPSCICSSSAEAGLQSCINCAVDATPSADVISAAQQLIDTYEQTCPGADVVIPGTSDNTPTTAKSPTPTSVTPVTPPKSTTQPVIPTPVQTTVIAPSPTQTQTIISTGSRPPSTSATQTADNSIIGGSSGALSIHAPASVGFLGVVVAVAMFAL